VLDIKTQYDEQLKTMKEQRKEELKIRG